MKQRKTWISILKQGGSEKVGQKKLDVTHI